MVLGHQAALVADPSVLGIHVLEGDLGNVGVAAHRLVGNREEACRVRLLPKDALQLHAPQKTVEVARARRLRRVVAERLGHADELLDEAALAHRLAHVGLPLGELEDGLLGVGAEVGGPPAHADRRVALAKAVAQDGLGHARHERERARPLAIMALLVLEHLKGAHEALLELFERELVLRRHGDRRRRWRRI
jgi:hypothetical protein